MSTVERARADRVDEIARPEYWRERFPGLSINASRLARPKVAQIDVAPDQMRRWRERLVTEGYLRGASPVLTDLSERLGKAVLRCVELDAPPAFIFLFDEAWELFWSLDPMLRGVLGDNYKAIPAFWTWHVDPRKVESGWRPHRDRDRFALRGDRGPAALTVWIPFTEATPDNGCMYLLPANHDPVYATENEAKWQIDVSKVRALPAKPGEFLAWNQALLHWGGQSSAFATTPRMSASVEFQMGERAPFDPKAPMIEPFADLSFEMRLKLVAKMILQYRHMYNLPERFAALGQRLLAG